MEIEKVKVKEIEIEKQKQKLILDLDKKIHELKNQQNFNECLNLIEKNIGLKSEAYGKKSKEVIIKIKKNKNFFNFFDLYFFSFIAF